MVTQDQALRLTQQCMPHLSPSETRRPTTKDIQLKSLCRLWAGMGHIYRVDVWNGQSQFVMKHVTPPQQRQLSLGDRRKANSYRVEAQFYQWRMQQQQQLQIPTPYFVEFGPATGEITICMSLLQGRGIDTSNLEQVQGALDWLAQFHALYWGDDVVTDLVQAKGLQPVASYWHLDTRPDEHANMSRVGWEGRLKRASRALDACLKRDYMQSLVHGDPKEANIMVLQNSSNNNNKQVAFYDFQYCGKGTPTRDLCYFLCSSCDESDEDELVQYYYHRLIHYLQQQKAQPIPTWEHFQDSLELAFGDYCRFMCGWGHWGYDTTKRAQALLYKLDGGTDLGSEEAYDEAIRTHFW